MNTPQHAAVGTPAAALDAKITEQIDINQQRLGVLTTQPKNFVADL